MALLVHNGRELEAGGLLVTVSRREQVKAKAKGRRLRHALFSTALAGHTSLTQVTVTT